MDLWHSTKAIRLLAVVDCSLHGEVGFVQIGQRAIDYNSVRNDLLNHHYHKLADLHVSFALVVPA